MKILHVIPSVNPTKGGPIQGIRNYQNDLVHLGVHRDLVTFENPEDIKLWQFPESLNLIGLGKSQTNLQYNKNLIPWLKKNIYNYDYIIINGIWSYHSYATLKTLKWLKKHKSEFVLPKVFVMTHGMLDPWFQKDKSRRLKAIRNFFYWHLIEKKVINNAEGLLFTCEEELLLARTTFRGYRPNLEINIGYGIEAPPTQSENLKIAFQKNCTLDSNEPYILFLSRIHPKKGLNLLLKAYGQLLQNTEFDSKMPTLIIAGPGMDTDYGMKLSQYLEQNPIIKTKVHFVGHLSGDAKWGAIYGCDAFVLPSHQENFGIAVAEALACYKPVLITNKVNIYREIENGDAGIVDDDTLEGTIANIKKWICLNSVSKLKMGQDAYKVYQNHFDSKSAAERLVAVLKSQI
jgi:glycosyltransferase involved in cell wall biosynthesis